MSELVARDSLLYVVEGYAGVLALGNQLYSVPGGGVA